MDEDDSQDELINRSSKKGKRAALWAISDDSDEAGSEEEAESGSGEDDEKEHLDREDDEEDEDDEDEDEEEEEDDDAKVEEGACAGTSADVAEVSSDEEAEKCPICLHSFTRQPVATPENCEHYFCLDCILEWSKNANSCPIDRIKFKVIYLRTCYGGKVQKVITVQKPAKQCQQDTIDVDLEETSCEVCGSSDREDRLLLCDGCDAGYHMECLTPPLDAVPVEEWFCPECEANNRQSRGSATEISDTDSLPSTTRPASSRPRFHAGHIRAIARTQHSERVRANVNRHRITQARTQELAPTYLIRSTWLDETINAVVAGLNSAVYVRDMTPRSSTSRRRKTGRSRKSSSKGKSTGVKRRKRKKRRTKSRKKLTMKKANTIRSRIANNLGIVKDKKSSSLPTVYRPSESTLSNMRADIGAASLSIYGDPFDLDPFTDQEEEEEQAHDSSLLEAKRRGISRSAFRSHQPVARPVSLSRRPVNIPQAGGVAEAAPVPDLLGSILSGQSMLLMDSSDVVINRDGSLMNTKPATLTNTLTSDVSNGSSSGDGSLHTSAGVLPNHVDTLGSLYRHFSQSSSGLSPPIRSTASHSETTSHVPHGGNPRLLGSSSHEPNRPNQRLAHQITNVRECREIVSLSSHLSTDSTSKSKTSSHSHSKKAPTKPMWVDVSVLPRIPKKRRESSADDASSRNDHSNNNNRNGASSSGTSATSTNGYGMPETGIHRLAGDKERRHSVDQQHGRSDGQRNRPDGAGTSSGFSSSFSSSSSASHTNHQRHSSSSSSSSSVSFRISSSGNSWHSRRLNITAPAPSGACQQEQRKDEEERKRQLHRDKQKLLASRSITSNNIYDPFNPTESDSDSSDGAGEGTKAECSSRLKEEFPGLKDKALPQSKQELSQVKVETQSPRSEDKPVTAASQMLKQRLKFTKENLKENKKESRFTESLVEKQSAPPKNIIKKEPESDADEAVKHESHSETEDNTQTVKQKQDHFKMTKNNEMVKEEPAPDPPASPRDNNTSAASSSSPVRSKHKSEIKSETHTKSPSKDLGIEKKTSKKPKDQRARSSSPERDRRQGHSESKHGGSQKEKDKVKSSRRSRSKERRAHRVSDSSQSKSPDRTSKKRRHSRSRSKDRRRSRSRSSSKERSRVKKHKKQTSERNEDKEVKLRSLKDKKHDRSRSKSRSKSRSRSRSRERRRRHSHSKSRSRSRSRSREKRKDDSSHQSSRDNVESCLNEKRKRRSRSSSREKKKERPATKSQKTTDSNSSSAKNKKTTKDKKKDEETPNKAEKTSKPSKAEPSFSSKLIRQVKKEPKEAKIEEKIVQAVDKTVKIKKEKYPTFDIFEDSPNNNNIKKEEMDTPVTVMEAKCKEETIKTEICEPEKSKAKSPDILVSSLNEQTMAISNPPHDTPEQSLEVATVSVKQEVHLPSDSDDDFNVDAILDNLDLLKPRSEKGTENRFKQEKEEKNEGETAAVGSKSKTQVKRVTWNIQEPERPQPDKSASKVALYKLKLKQEGIRRPSSVPSTSSQDLTGTASDVKTGGDQHSSSDLGFDSIHPLSFSEADDGGSLQKDKQYLKKLHMQERAIEEVKLAIKPFYQKREINKEEYKEILRKAVQKVCHSKSGEINPVKVGNLVKAYVDKYKHARKYKKGEESGKTQGSQSEPMKGSDSP